jgi:hypothetical protein
VGVVRDIFERCIGRLNAGDLGGLRYAGMTVSCFVRWVVEDVLMSGSSRSKWG